VKQSQLTHLITEVLTELESDSPAWASYIVEGLKNIIGGHYREDYFVKSSDSLIIYLNAADINAIMVKPKQDISKALPEHLPNAKYHLVLRMSDGSKVDFDDLSFQEIKKQVSAYL
jgi:hypothetical protein